MHRFELIFQFAVGSAALTCLNVYIFHDKLPKAVGISLIVWLAFLIGRAGGRLFRRLNGKAQG